MAKRPTLTDALAKKNAAETGPALSPAVEALAKAAESVEAAPPVVARPAAKATVAPSRQHTRQLTAHVDPIVLKTIKMMAVEMDRPQQHIFAEAINDWLEKHGKPRLANERTE